MFRDAARKAHTMEGTRSAAGAGMIMRPLCSLLFAAAVLPACGTDLDAYRPLQVGDPAPAFAAPVIGGDTLRLADLHGAAIMLNVWATWCPPCREEMPGLQALHEQYGGRGLRVIGVSIDSRGAESAIRGFAEDHGITFTILHDPGESVARLFRTRAVPETFLIDADGRIAHRWIGMFDPLAPDVAERVEAALADP
jgi:peroxiredoxin